MQGDRIQGSNKAFKPLRPLKYNVRGRKAKEIT